MTADSTRIVLPPKPFLYTLDQVAGMLQLSMDIFTTAYVWFHMRTLGPKIPGQLMAVNIAPDNKPPEWRISEMEFRRWLKVKGFRVSTTPVY